MRKLIAIPLLVLYFTAVSGMMIQLHFCGERLLSWKVNESSVKCCCESSAKNSEHAQKAKIIKSKGEDCCKSKTITLKIQQDQNRANELQLQLASIQMVSPVLYQIIPQAIVTSDAQYLTYQANAPPGRWQQIPLYLLHGNFTYYG
jgi:hypothetical protein